MTGFYRSSYVDLASGIKKIMAVTQFEATEARKAFPCWDEPEIKSKFIITLIIPKDLVGLSNMNEEFRKESEDGKSLIIKFKETPIMSTYLVAWIVGDLEYIEETNEDGVLVRVYATPGHVNQGKFGLNVASRALAFYTRYFDQPYPLPKMDMVAVPDIGSEAMENWGLVTYRMAYLLFDEKDSSLKTKQNVTYIVAHELAHQWFGNLVTMEWWSDLWLNEGFATWVGWLATDFLFPEWDIWTEFVFDDFQAGLALDGMRSSHPIEVPIKNSSEINQIFDSISYSKGASIIRMLVKYLGEDIFKRGMRSYLTKHKYRNAKTSDLWISLAEASGQPVAEIMTAWTKIIGYPVLTVEAKFDKDGLNLKITQNRFLNSGGVQSVEDQTFWSIPLLLTTDAGVVDAAGLLTSRSDTITLPFETLFFKFNCKQAGFYRVHYPAEWFEKLGQAIEANKFSAELFLMLSPCRLLARFPFWWEEDEAIQNKLCGFIRSLYAHQVLALGFEPRADEGDKTSLLRPLILGMAGKCGDVGVLQEARVRFDRFAAGDYSAIHPNLRGVIYTLVIRNGSQTEFDKVFDLYQKFTVPDQKLSALSALGASKEPSVIQAALELSKRVDLVRPQDCIYVFLAVGINSVGRRVCWEFLQQNWNFFYDHYYRGSFLLLSQIVSFCTQELTLMIDADIVENFFAEKDVTLMDRTIQQSLEKIRSNSIWLSVNKENVSHWLSLANFEI